MKKLTLLFLIDDGKILLAMKKRGFGMGRWNGVGGKVETGETVEQAMLRECYEEIKVKPVNYKKISDIKFNEYHEGKAKSFLVNVFSCSKWSGKPTETDEMSPKWFNFNEIPYDDMWPDDRYWLKYVLQSKSFSAEFSLNENDEIISHIISEAN